MPRPKTSDAGKRVHRLDTDEIVAATLRVIEHTGVDGFTMRRLAEELNRSAMATYRHVGTKDELLSRAADSVLANVDVTTNPSAEWTERFKTIALSVWKQVSQYPWIPAYLLNHADSPNLQRIFNELSALLGEVALDRRDAEEAMVLAWSFVVGLLSWLPRDGGPGRPATIPKSLDTHLVFGVETIAAGLLARSRSDRVRKRPAAVKPKRQQPRS